MAMAAGCGWLTSDGPLDTAFRFLLTYGAGARREGRSQMENFRREKAGDGSRESESRSKEPAY